MALVVHKATRSLVVFVMLGVAVSLATGCEHRTPELEMHESTLPLDGTAHSLGPDIDTHDPGPAMGPLTQPTGQVQMNLKTSIGAITR